MPAFRHWTPRYVADRIALELHTRAHPDEPWITPQMVEILTSWLRPTDVGMEFGSGRSTLWFAQRLGQLTSVEHDTSWYANVKERLARARVQVDYRLCPDGEHERADSSYVDVARSAAPNSVDFTLVDGAARDHCALVMIEKLRPGGLLVVDNVNWFLPHATTTSPASRRDHCSSTEWSRFRVEVRTWRHAWTSNGVTDTALWVKP